MQLIPPKGNEKSTFSFSFRQTVICRVKRLTESCQSDENFALTRKLFTLVKSNRYSTSIVDVENFPCVHLFFFISETIPTMVHVLLKF